MAVMFSGRVTQPRKHHAVFDGDRFDGRTGKQAVDVGLQMPHIAGHEDFHAVQPAVFIGEDDRSSRPARWPESENRSATTPVTLTTAGSKPSTRTIRPGSLAILEKRSTICIVDLLPSPRRPDHSGTVVAPLGRKPVLQAARAKASKPPQPKTNAPPPASGPKFVIASMHLRVWYGFAPRQRTTPSALARIKTPMLIIYVTGPMWPAPQLWLAASASQSEAET